MTAIAPTPATASIYVVDDEPHVAELYTIVLESADYRVSAFHDRGEALQALATARRKPDLLITDYQGLSMPVEWFMHRCLVTHPALRILMISGFHQADVRFSWARPNRYIQKPFGLAHFRKEVRAALASSIP
jgi:DNA-binding NtrC family response regulator